jgi:prepilin signal peptidase PulO-like enzyme (type II secretory pathway)
MTVWYLLLGAACLFTGVAAFVDFRSGLIPNSLTLPLLAVGLPVHVVALALASPKTSTAFWIGDALLGVLLCGLVPWILWRTGGMGGGDLKLFAALGGLLGARAGLELELVAFTAAALLVPAVLAYRGQLLAVLSNTARLVTNPFVPVHKRRRMPVEMMTEVRFGPAIFLATLLVSAARLMR